MQRRLRARCGTIGTVSGADWPVDWIKVHNSLSEVGRMVESGLSEQPRTDYQEFVNVAEGHLAVDHLAYWLVEEQVPVSAQLREELLPLAELFHLTEQVTRALSQCPVELDGTQVRSERDFHCELAHPARLRVLLRRQPGCAVGSARGCHRSEMGEETFGKICGVLDRPDRFSYELR